MPRREAEAFPQSFARLPGLSTDGRRRRPRPEVRAVVGAGGKIVQLIEPVIIVLAGHDGILQPGFAHMPNSGMYDARPAISGHCGGARRSPRGASCGFRAAIFLFSASQGRLPALRTHATIIAYSLGKVKPEVLGP